MSTREEQSSQTVVGGAQQHRKVSLSLKRVSKKYFIASLVLVFVVLCLLGWWAYVQYKHANTAKRTDKQIQAQVSVHQNIAKDASNNQKITSMTDAAMVYATTYQYDEALNALLKVQKDIPNAKNNQYYLVNLFSIYYELGDEKNEKSTAQDILALKKQGNDYSSYASDILARKIESLGQ